jgi:hypothetical protein
MTSAGTRTCKAHGLLEVGVDMHESKEEADFSVQHPYRYEASLCFVKPI